MPVRVPPLDVGTHVISVRVSPLPGEVITENNETQALLRVRPGFERVLYLEGEPRFEFAFLRRAFDGDSAVRLVGLLRSAKGKYLRINVNDSLDLVNGFPTRRDELFQYRGVILGSIEASYFTADQLRMLADFVDRRGGALIALGGRQALAEGGFAGTAVAEVLPFTLEKHGRRAADTGMATLRIEPTRPASTIRHCNSAPRRRRTRPAGIRSPPLTSVNHLGDLRAGAETLLVGQPLPRGERSADPRRAALRPWTRRCAGRAGYLDLEDGSRARRWRIAPTKRSGASWCGGRSIRCPIGLRLPRSPSGSVPASR